jgi:hypothetical protein
MADNTIELFVKGVHNLLDKEVIPKDAAQDSSNFVTKNGKVVLVGGRKLIGTAGAAGKITGEHFGYKVDGTKVHYAKFGTVIKYWDGNSWEDCITGLEENEDYWFENYSSLAGAFTFVNGKSAFYKIINSHPANPINIYDAAKNFYGRILIDRGRMLLWNREKDKTGLYGSRIDPQNSTVYTTVTSEAIGALGSTTYTGTLAFKSGGTKRNAFGVSFVATVGAGTETFTDNYLGVLTSNFGGTGTINYSTGAYSVTFSAVTTGAVTANYQWEDSTALGIADFTHTATRLAAEGFQFPQDQGGDAILTVLIGIDGAYYSIKSQSTYRLALDETDLSATNELFRRDIGVPTAKAAVSTSKGIVLINTANPTEPTMTILQRNEVGTEVEPVVLFPHFKFANFVYDDAYFGSYDRWVLVFCKSAEAVNNDRILMCDILKKTVDIVSYTGRTSTQDSGNLYVGDSATKTVYQIFNGFDDLDNSVEGYWMSKKDTFKINNLKKYRRQRIKGSISPSQKVEVYIDFDNSGFSLVGTILGTASYVDQESSQAIGGNTIADAQIGGDTIGNIFDYHCELKLRTPKFRARTIKLVPTGIGYFDFNLLKDWDILTFEDRMPKGKRSKQNVSLDGTQTDQ